MGVITLKPYPHQIEAKEYLHKRGSGYLYIEQRGGKTKPTVTAILEQPLSEVLIATKSTSMVVWRAELMAQGVPEDQIQVIYGTGDQRKKRLKAKVPFIICNWDMLFNYRVVDERFWECIVFDESSCMANGSSKVTRYLMRAMRRLRELSFDREPKIYSLSGNPSPESPIQYASQAIITDGSFLGYTRLDDYIYTEWKDNPLKPGVVNKMQPKSPIHLAQIKGWVEKQCFVRTLEGLNLGSKILYSRRHVEMNKAQKKAMKWAIAKINAMGEIGEKVFVGYMNQIAAGVDPNSGEMINLAKIQEVLACYQDNPEPIVVFSFFKAPLRAADELFRQMGVSCRLITGETNKNLVDDVVADFQEGGFPVLFAQTDLIKMGRDLSRSSQTYYLNNSFSNDTRDQSVMRTTNILKKTPVSVTDICTKGWDEAILDMLINKNKISDSYLVHEYTKSWRNNA